jgi:hypothetical protein
LLLSLLALLVQKYKILTQRCYIPAGVAGATCAACPSGTYRAVADESCRPCPDNSVSLQGAVEEVHRAFLAQTYLHYWYKSTNTDAETFFLMYLQAACTCKAGYLRSNAQRCVACVAGTYKRAQGNQACESCPLNATSVTAATSPDECECKVLSFLALHW